MVVIDDPVFNTPTSPGESFSNNNALMDDDEHDSATGGLERYTTSSPRKEAHETKFGTSRHLDELLNESHSQNSDRKKKTTEKDILSEATSLLNELLMDSPSPAQQTRTKISTNIKNVEKTQYVTTKVPTMRIKVNNKPTYRQQQDDLIKTHTMKELLDDAEDINDLLSHTIENRGTKLSESTSETSLSSGGPLNETGYNSLSQSETEEDSEDDDDTSSVGSVDLDTLLNDISSRPIREETDDELEELEGEENEENDDAEVTIRSNSPQLAPSPCPTEDRVLVRSENMQKSYLPSSSFLFSTRSVVEYCLILKIFKIRKYSNNDLSLNKEQISGNRHSFLF